MQERTHNGNQWSEPQIMIQDNFCRVIKFSAPDSSPLNTIRFSKKGDGSKYLYINFKPESPDRDDNKKPTGLVEIKEPKSLNDAIGAINKYLKSENQEPLPKEIVEQVYKGLEIPTPETPVNNFQKAACDKVSKLDHTYSLFLTQKESGQTRAAEIARQLATRTLTDVINMAHNGGVSSRGARIAACPEWIEENRTQLEKYATGLGLDTKVLDAKETGRVRQ